MTRTAAREVAARLVFSMNISGQAPDVLLEEFFEEGHFLSLIDEDPLFKGMPDDRQMDYIRRLVTLCHEHRAEIDRHIETYSKGWKPKRISGTAAAVLRCALCEILYMDDIPDSAAINEAVELAKKYDEPQTVSFVNGVLGGFMRGRQPSGEVSDPVAASEPLAESGE